MGFTVAIDGPAAAGKGTISKAVAAYFDMAHLDTGLLYRAVGALVLCGKNPLVAAQSLRSEDLEGPNLRSAEVAQAASQVAVMADVRAVLIDFQRQFAWREDGAVLDGRDIGTVILPEAKVKLFLTADAEVRAERRYKELQESAVKTSFAQVLSDVIMRDTRDRERTAAPMVAAADAVVIDTSCMSMEAAIAAAIAVVQKGISS